MTPKEKEAFKNIQQAAIDLDWDLSLHCDDADCVVAVTLGEAWMIERVHEQAGGEKVAVFEMEEDGDDSDTH